MQTKLVNILGTEYKVVYKSDAEVAAAMYEDCGGYCGAYSHEIVIAELDSETNCTQEEKDALLRENLRHELIHAFLNESGLKHNANGTDCWAKNEEMVDWFAIQSPKIFEVYSSLGLL